MSEEEIITRLFQTIQSRRQAEACDSYVASLFAKGTGKIAQKVGEEAVEAVIEAMRGEREALKNESADLLFHLLVLWADQGIAPKDVFAILEARMGTSGHTEKNSRTTS